MKKLQTETVNNIKKITNGTSTIYVQLTKTGYRIFNSQMSHSFVFKATRTSEHLESLKNILQLLQSAVESIEPVALTEEAEEK